MLRGLAVGFALLFLAGMAQAQAPAVQRLDRAEFTLAEDALDGSGGHSWTGVALPDRWRQSRPGVAGTA